MRMIRLIVVVVVALGLSLAFGAATASAQAASGNLSHSYQADSPIAAGSLVSLKSAHSRYVTPANVGNADQLIGVAVAPHDSLLAVDSSATEAQVALSGVVPVLVSTLNGSISSGTQIAVSAVNGVGMKAEPGSRVIGVAQAAFTKQSPNAALRTVHTKPGQSKQVVVGYVPVTIAIGSVPKPTQGAEQLPGWHRFAASLVGHPVSSVAVIVSAIVALVSLIALVSLVFGTIRGSLVSIGRNPLAKQAIFQSLAQVLAMALLIALLAAAIDYFILR